MSNGNLNQSVQKPKFSVAITTSGYQRLINNTLGDPDRAKRFIATITSAVAVNPALQECEAGTILAAALLGESLNLSPSPQLGQFYMVPFEDKKAGVTNAQFILGYKGYMQLAQRSGYVVALDAVPIKEGELVKHDPIKGKYEFDAIQDFDQRLEAPTIGYYAYFELVNGYRKEIYWSKEHMESHADRFSPAFSKNKYRDLCDGKIPGLTLEMIQNNVYIADKELFKMAKSMSSFWYKQFDDMAVKTMIRQLISRGGCPMSTEMMRGFESDNSIVEVKDDGAFITTPEETKRFPEPEATEVVEKVDLDEI